MSRREAFFVQDPNLYVKYREERFSRYEYFDYIKNPKDAPAVHPRSLHYNLYEEALLLCISRYSRGDELSVLKDFFSSKVVASLKTYRRFSKYRPFDFSNIDEYMNALWTLSLGILLGVSKADMEAIAHGVGNEGEDQLYDSIAAKTLFGHTIGTGQHHQKPFGLLVQALEQSGEEQQKSIDTFLKTWYKGLSAAAWYELHAKNNAGFFGYWSFELAVVVKLWGIEDKAFASNLFYPRDLVASKLFKTWLDDEEGESDREAYKSKMDIVSKDDE